MADPIALKGLVESLVNRSETFESHAGIEHSQALQALEELNDLSALTEQSLEALNPPAPVAPAVEKAPIIGEPKKHLTPPSRAASAKVQVSEKYKSPVLRDESVLNALLDFHTLRDPMRGATVAPRPSASRSMARSPKPTSPQFSPAEIPVVEVVQPKEPSRRAIRASEPTASVLRSSGRSRETE